MPKFPKPHFRKDRKTWVLVLDGHYHYLGADREKAFEKYHTLMSQRKTVTVLPTAKETRGPRVVDVCDWFLDWVQKNKAAGTYESYRRRLQQFVSFATKTYKVKELLVSELRPFHVQDWLDSHPEWNGGMKHGRAMSAQTAFNWAVKCGRLASSPIEHLSKPPQGRRDKVITPEQHCHLLHLAEPQAFRDVLLVAWETGCRPQEIIRVEARHLDHEQKTWVFPKHVVGGKERGRTIFCNSTAWQVCLHYAKLYPEGKLFRNAEAKPWMPDGINSAMARLRLYAGRAEAKRRGLKHLYDPEAWSHLPTSAERAAARRKANQGAARLVTKYALVDYRHSFATRLIKAGVDPLTVAELMGHVDVAMVARVYAHLRDREHLRKALEKGTQP